ncbi:MAG: hypothetical protein J5848_07705 [Bacteroidales bacterium]|nr:hypothetical protein [Bacteroidales bacterium]
MQYKNSLHYGGCFFVPLTELFSNNFMEDLEKIWELRTFIPNPSSPPLLYRSTDTKDVD